MERHSPTRDKWIPRKVAADDSTPTIGSRENRTYTHPGYCAPMVERGILFILYRKRLLGFAIYAYPERAEPKGVGGIAPQDNGD